MNNKVSRVQMSKKNIIIGIISQIIICFTVLINRNIFLNILGIEYLGMSNVLYSLVTIFSVAEIGIGEAISFALYKPLAEGNTKQINGILRLLRKFYKIVAIIILCIGILFTPFLKYILKDSMAIPHIYLIYFMYLINASSTYLYSYKRILLTADQHKYIDTLVSTFVNILMYVFQIGVLILFKNFILFFFLQILNNIILNIWLSHIVNKRYSHYFNDSNSELSFDERKKIFRNLFALAIQRVNGVVALSIDSIILSVMLGTTIVGKYNNYMMIEKYLTQFIVIIFSSLSGSIGNLIALETKEQQFIIFKRIDFLAYFIFTITAVCLFTSSNSFISLWLNNDELILNSSIIFVIALNYYILGVRQPITLFKNAYGLYWEDRFKPIFTVIVNVFCSVLLTKLFGIIGVALGTMISYLFVNTIVEPFVLFKHGFKKNVAKYYIMYTLKLLSFVILAIVLNLVYSNINISNSLVKFFVINCTNVFVLGVVGIVLFGKNEYMRYYLRLVKNLFFQKRSSK